MLSLPAGQASPNPSTIPENNAKYIYSTLKEQEIRLIEILPATKTSPIRCKIFHSSLDDDEQPYECLSYMWGPPSQPQSISMHGKSTAIGENLEAAMRAIRHEKDTRIVWIDALCINQNDVSERSSQVALMGRIFQRAANVLVWLGEAADDSDILVEHIVREENEDPWEARWEGPLNQQYEKALLAFYSRPYWRRVWVIQEIFTAKSIHLFCGSQSIEYQKFHFGYFSFETKMEELKKEGKTPLGCTDDPASEFFGTPGARILRQRGSGGKLEDFSLLRLLELCATIKSECKLIHDRVYGLVGILKSSQSGSIVPDYSKTLAELCIDVLISIFVPDTGEHSHWISVWGYIGKDLIASTRIVQRLLEDPLWNTTENKFHPLRSICNASQLERMRNLRLDVWMEGIGVIKEVGDALTPDEFLNEKDRTRSVIEGTQEDRFRRALEGLEKRDFYLNQEIGTRYMKKLTDPTTDTFDPIEESDITQHNIAVTCKGLNRPFKTRNGVMGFASSAIQKGDLLYGVMTLAGLFMDTSLFLIIRPGSDPSMHSFTLIGRAILLPVPRERYCDIRSQRRRGRFSDFNFKGDLYAEGISLDEDNFEEITCFMDIVTLFHLTK